MLDVGFSELLVFGVIALLVLGPEKLPEAARFAAKWYGKLKRTVSNVQNDIDRELRLSELREQMNQEMQRIQELEEKMQHQMQTLQQQANQPISTATTASMQPNPIQYHYMPQSIPALYIATVYIQYQHCSPPLLAPTNTSGVVPEFQVAV